MKPGLYRVVQSFTIGKVGNTGLVGIPCKRNKKGTWTRFDSNTHGVENGELVLVIDTGELTGEYLTSVVFYHFSSKTTFSTERLHRLEKV